jgi:hypothetical protein
VTPPNCNAVNTPNCALLNASNEAAATCVLSKLSNASLDSELILVSSAPICDVVSESICVDVRLVTTPLDNPLISVPKAASCAPDKSPNWVAVTPPNWIDVNAPNCVLLSASNATPAICSAFKLCIALKLSALIFVSRALIC